jgi:hypothetical protein
MFMEEHAEEEYEQQEYDENQELSGGGPDAATAPVHEEAPAPEVYVRQSSLLLRSA